MPGVHLTLAARKCGSPSKALLTNELNDGMQVRLQADRAVVGYSL